MKGVPQGQQQRQRQKEQQTAGARVVQRATYREWVTRGAHGCFLAESVAVNAVRMLDPLDRTGAFFVRRDIAQPDQHALREMLPDTDREEVSGAEKKRVELADWVIAVRVERAAEVVRRGWLAWETVGEIVIPHVSGEAREAATHATVNATAWGVDGGGTAAGGRGR